MRLLGIIDEASYARWILLELKVINSPFNEEQVELLNRLLPGLTETQRVWLSGFLAAAQGAPGASAAAGAAPAQAEAVPAQPVSKEATVLFASQTGNSHGLAKKLTKQLQERGFEVTLSSMGDFKPNTLKKVQNLLIVASTHGEGDPPDNALAFYEFLHSKRAPGLEGTRFAVLALGDTSYEKFCQTGKDFDKRLEELGAARIIDRTDCDVDFEEAASEWINRVVGALSAAGASNGAAAPGLAVAAPAASAAKPEYSRTNPFYAEVLENVNLNGRGSAKETRHIELSLEGSSLEFDPGDCIGIYPENDLQLVDEIIAAMDWRAEEPVTPAKDTAERPLREALLRHCEISLLTKPVLEQVAELSASSDLKGLLSPERKQELKAYMCGRDLLDLIRDYGLKGIPAKEFTAILRKLPPRLYSISSSLKAAPDEAHVTIGAVRYEAHGRKRNGVCSVYLAERVRPGDKVPLFVQRNDHFKLPDDPDVPVIMIGPGTGVAPFRSFLQEREETGAAGKAWMFFGEQHFATDFLYQLEFQRWLKSGVLERMDVAFSRDGSEKVYVQHRMLERSKELYQWLQEGAAVYVCGDKQRMAQDVHNTLIAILEQEGNLSAEEAAEYVARMQQQKRYQRDVY